MKTEKKRVHGVAIKRKGSQILDGSFLAFNSSMVKSVKRKLIGSKNTRIKGKKCQLGFGQDILS